MDRPISILVCDPRTCNTGKIVLIYSYIGGLVDCNRSDWVGDIYWHMSYTMMGVNPYSTNQNRIICTHGNDHPTS